MVSYVFVFVIENMGSILPVTSSFLGIMLGPTLGLFSLGMMFPWANSIGSLMGIITTFVIMITFVIGNNVKSSEFDQTLPLITSGCNNYTDANVTYLDYLDFSRAQSDWKNQDESFLEDLLSISYMWYSGLSCILCVFFGLVFSVCVNMHQRKRGNRILINAKCISPPLLTLFRKFMPSHIAMWVAEDENNNVDDFVPDTQKVQEKL